jgi:CheY-like chemotaxis protein
MPRRREVTNMMPNPVRVLVADDHPINRLVFRAIFGHLGCGVHEVDNGEAALIAAALEDFDLICLDRHMPGLTGDEVAAQLPKDRFVVAWSTDLSDLPARFNHILAKPLTAESAGRALALALAWRNAAPQRLKSPCPRLRRHALR